MCRCRLHCFHHRPRPRPRPRPRLLLQLHPLDCTRPRYVLCPPYPFLKKLG